MALISRNPDRRQANDRTVGKGALAGMIGGLIGTIIMTQFQNAWSTAAEALNSSKSKNGTHNQQNEEEKEDSTMKAAAKIAELGGRQLSHEQKKKLGPVVHYSFGAFQGAIYGGAMELSGTSGGLLPGLIFGASLFVVADEIAVPAFGFSSKPSESPLSSHLYGLLAHLVYGASTEIARRGVRASM